MGPAPVFGGGEVVIHGPVELAGTSLCECSSTVLGSPPAVRSLFSQGSDLQLSVRLESVIW